MNMYNYPGGFVAISDNELAAMKLPAGPMRYMALRAAQETDGAIALLNRHRVKKPQDK